MKIKIISLLFLGFTLNLQSQVYRNTATNTTYNHFIRDGGGAALYINQVDDSNPILRLSSGVSNPNENVLFTVENNGGVGIGTQTLGTYKLAVEGSTLSENFRTKTTSTNYNHFVRTGGGAAVYINQVDNSSPILRLSSGVSNPNENVMFTVENNGSVGIGTTAIPENTKLGVNGKISATEVNVALIGNWSDFVFYKNYELPSLLEVEKHIQEKGHLKDIPNEAEVSEKGILLGEMNAKLLQKIEELTLYTIQQQKEIERLKLIEQRLIKIEKLINTMR